MKLSIITPVFNDSANLDVTLQAISRLKETSVEVLVVDGGSTDDTVEVARRYSGLVSAVHSGPDGGIYDAMNTGLAMATGEFVWFINAGDEPASPEAADILDELPPADLHWGDALLIDKSRNVIGLSRGPRRLVSKAFINGMSVCHQAVIVRRTICPKYDSNLRYVADQKWIRQLIAANLNMRRHDKPLARYLLGGISESRLPSVVAEKIGYSFREMSMPAAVQATCADMVKVLKWSARSALASIKAPE